jgi:hypothetical protein
MEKEDSELWTDVGLLYDKSPRDSYRIEGHD